MNFPIKSYLPKKYKLFFLSGIGVLWVFDGPWIFLMGLFLLVLFWFRQKPYHLKKDHDGRIYTPVSGKVLSSQTGHENVITILMPWWGEKGIYLPFDSEIKDVRPQNSGSNLLLENTNRQTLQLLFPSQTPKIYVLPGDKGQNGVSIGYMPMGGTVKIKMPAQETMLVQKGDTLCAGKSLLGRFH